MNIELIKKIFNIANDSTSRYNFLAKYIIHNLNLVESLSISEMAKKTFTSISSINRFCKTLNVVGFKELTHAIKYYNECYVDIRYSEDNDGFASNQDGYLEIFNDMFKLNVRALHSSFRLLVRQQDALASVTRLIKNAGKIVVFAVGGTYNVALDFIDKLLRMNLNVVYSDDYHKAFYLAKNITSEDVAILISYSGETEELLKIAKIVNENNAQLVSLTKNVKNSLYKMAQHRLTIDSEENVFRIYSQSSRFALLYALDCIVNCVYHDDPEKFKKILQNNRVKKI